MLNLIIAINAINFVRNVNQEAHNALHAIQDSFCKVALALTHARPMCTFKTIKLQNATLVYLHVPHALKLLVTVILVYKLTIIHINFFMEINA